MELPVQDDSPEELPVTRNVRVEYDINLQGEGRVVRVRFVRTAKTIGDFVVQLETHLDGQFRPVVRYDGSHGHPHRDLLDWDGETIEKRWSPGGMTNSQALTDAIYGLVTNAEQYMVEFVKRRP